MAGGAGGIATGRGSGKNPITHGFVKREHLWPFALVTSLFFLWGFAYGLLDVLNKHFQTILHITKLESTGLQVAYFGGGYFCYSPVAAWIMKRYGYKKTIISGLCLYSLGAILFWPTAHSTLNGNFNSKAVFVGFVMCTLVIACGLSTLEVAANSFVTVLPERDPEISAFRLNFSQSFNGVASFCGPLIASKYFFTKGEQSLYSVQYVYLAVSGMGLCIIAAFIFTRLPDISEEELAAEAAAQEALAMETEVVTTSFWRSKAPLGFVAQFLYVGAQVTIGSFFLNLSAETANIPDSRGSQLLSYGLILFTVGRFAGTALLSVMNAPLVLAIYAFICCGLTVGIAAAGGMGSVVCCMVIMFFESIMYPLIFVLGTNKLGRHTRRAAGLLVQGVAGGAVFPPMQGAIADAKSTRISYWIVLPCFVFICFFGLMNWRESGYSIRAAAPILDQIVQVEAAVGAQLAVSPLRDFKSSVDEKDGELQYVEKI